MDDLTKRTIRARSLTGVIPGGQAPPLDPATAQVVQQTPPSATGALLRAGAPVVQATNTLGQPRSLTGLLPGGQAPALGTVPVKAPSKAGPAPSYLLTPNRLDSTRPVTNAAQMPKGLQPQKATVTASPAVDDGLTGAQHVGQMVRRQWDRGNENLNYLYNQARRPDRAVTQMGKEFLQGFSNTVPTPGASATKKATAQPTAEQAAVQRDKEWQARVKADPTLALGNVGEQNPMPPLRAIGKNGAPTPEEREAWQQQVDEYKRRQNGTQGAPTGAGAVARQRLNGQGPVSQQVAGSTARQALTGGANMEVISGGQPGKNYDWSQRLYDLEQDVPAAEIQQAMQSPNMYAGDDHSAAAGVSVGAPTHDATYTKNMEDFYRRAIAVQQLNRERGYGIRGEDTPGGLISGPDGMQYYNPKNPAQTYATPEEAKRGQSYDTALGELALRKGNASIAQEALKGRLEQAKLNLERERLSMLQRAGLETPLETATRPDPIKMSDNDWLAYDNGDGTYTQMQEAGDMGYVNQALYEVQVTGRNAKMVMDQLRRDLAGNTRALSIAERHLAPYLQQQ